MNATGETTPDVGSGIELTDGPVPYIDEKENGEERLSISFCGLSMFLDPAGEPLEPIVAAACLTHFLYGIPCHDDPLLFQAGTDERWMNAVGALEPSTRGRAPVDAWPAWFIDMVLLEVL